MRACREMRTMLLEADPEALAGIGASPLAEHVRSCDGCRAIAHAILEETAAVDRFLAHAPSGPDVDAILAEADVPEAGAGTGSRIIAFPSWRRWTPLAAAAALVGLLLLPNETPVPTSRTMAPEGAPLVEVPAGQNVAVLPTANPDITVIWFF